MRARACIKCKEYVLIRPNDPQNLFLIKEFERIHSGHTLITLDFSEIQDSYTMYGAAEGENNSINIG
ncbi:MAG: hypothetical protein ACTSUN_04185 [Promethearchaeota archaeon]